jgi:glyoxylase-like metal-dependent hydrolase (beta-lactamase superfamily II)
MYLPTPTVRPMTIEGVERFRFAWPAYGEPLAVHVLDRETATVLFGTGAPGMSDGIVRLAAAHDVDAAVVEHAHDDHYGGAAALAETGVEIAAPAGDCAALEAADVPVDRPLAPGDEPWGVRVLDCPGHTPGNAAFLADGVLIAGDTVVGRDSTFAAADSGLGPLAVIDAAYSEDDARARESAAALADLDGEVRAVLVAHGSSVTDPGRAAGALDTLAAELRE